MENPQQALLAQLSAAQRSFVEFCAVLQELVLNQQVAQSVVESLQADLPALLQPNGNARSNSNSTSARLSAIGKGVRTAGPEALGMGPETARTAGDKLALMAPRLTPASSLPGGGGTTSHDVCYRAAVEVQDSYVVLQNATHKGRELLGRLRRLQDRAVEGVQQQEQQLPTESQGKGDWGGGGLEEPGEGGDVDVDVDVDVVLFGQAGEEQEDGGGGGGEGEAAGTEAGLPPATPERQLAALSLSPQQPAGTPAGGTVGAAAGLAVGTPAVAAGGHGAAGAGAGAVDAGCSGSSSSSDPGGKGRSRLLSDPELAVAMGELCREAAAEVEMLGRIANAVGAATPAEELYTYGMMLGLQPYMDEQLVEAAVRQREQLVGGPAAARGGNGGAGGGGGTPVAAAAAGGLGGKGGRGAVGSAVKR